MPRGSRSDENSYYQPSFDEVADVRELEREEESDEDTVIPLHYAITSYGADYPVDGLVKRIDAGSIFIPSFQREFVWSYRAASRFIESLLLGLPVPGIFLSREDGSNKLLVIDGQQRLLTLTYFYDGKYNDGRVFALKGVQKRFEGLTYETLSDEDRRRLDDSILHATLIKQDEPADDDSSIYQVFERLNTGGIPLKPQEIRSAIYAGSFSDLLRDLNQNKSWRSVFGKVNSNMRDQELILRFFALYFNLSRYSKPMKEFLNSYMSNSNNRNLSPQRMEEFSLIFTSTIELVQRCLGKQAFRPKNALNAAVFDAVMVALAHRLELGAVTDCARMTLQYDQLLANPDFKQATETATTDEENVQRRIRLATDAFAGVI